MNCRQFAVRFGPTSLRDVLLILSLDLGGLLGLSCPLTCLSSLQRKKSSPHDAELLNISQREVAEERRREPELLRPQTEKLLPAIKH